MIQKLTRSYTVTSIDFNKPSAFKGISKHALPMIDKTRLESLVTAVATTADGGYFKHYAVILLLDSSVAASNDMLPLLVLARKTFHGLMMAIPTLQRALILTLKRTSSPLLAATLLSSSKITAHLLK